jgi:hypothetical protein
MITSDPAADPRATLLRCPDCSRAFVAIGTDAVSEASCGCGGELVAHAMPRGLYELASREPLGGAPSEKRGEASAAKRPARIAAEPDHGYDASHGYGPAHGGPAGPGDAPASK